MGEHKVKIEAKSQDEFVKIEEMLAALPRNIYEQISTARNGLVGLECNIDYSYTASVTIILPHTAKQITQFENYIGVYADPYFIKLNGFMDPEGKTIKCAISYLIWEAPIPTKVSE